MLRADTANRTLTAGNQEARVVAGHCEKWTYRELIFYVRKEKWLSSVLQSTPKIPSLDSRKSFPIFD